jgi:pantetheine-phosphate adenylyltransferase
LSRIALYPGTFDPIHYGHLDIASRAARIFDRVLVAIYERPAKRLMFSVEKRLDLARRAVAEFPGVDVCSYSGLTVEFARQVGAEVIVRGLRVIADFELEYQMALTNRQLAPEVEVVCLMTRQEFAFLSSSIVKEIALLGGDVSSMVPPHVATELEARRLAEQDGAIPLVSLRD